MFSRRTHSIDVVEALARHAAGRLVLVDVREDGERARGYAPGSLHLPLAQLKHRLGELPEDRLGARTWTTTRTRGPDDLPPAHPRRPRLRQLPHRR